MFDLCLKKLREAKMLGARLTSILKVKRRGHTRQANSMGLKYSEQQLQLRQNHLNLRRVLSGGGAQEARSTVHSMFWNRELRNKAFVRGWTALLVLPVIKIIWIRLHFSQASLFAWAYQSESILLFSHRTILFSPINQPKHQSKKKNRQPNMASKEFVKQALEWLCSYGLVVSLPWISSSYY
jgi:hypothetical protein